MKNNSQQVILGIESSCDDTAAAVIINDKIHSNCVATQEVHKAYGGVVPELASRKHQQNLIPVVELALKQAGVELNDLNAIACSQGPGLLGSLLVGYTFAKGVSLSLDIPLINVNHIDAHIWAHFIGDRKPAFPFLCLLVSGGHTQIVKVNTFEDMEVLGRTLDDAAGEAFDKAGKMLNLPYPAGPVIDAYASKGDPMSHSFSTSKVGELDFSFSGLKTSILYYLRDKENEDSDFITKNIYDLCASIQYTIVSYLISKFRKALEQSECRSIGIAGGVAANSALRKAVERLGAEYGKEVYIPAMEYCTDNAAMIAQAAKYKFEHGIFGTLSDVCYTRNDEI